MPRPPVSLEEFLTRCPKDIEILEYLGLTKPCKFRCRRCGEVYTKNASQLYDKRGKHRVNCLCEGQTVGARLSIPLDEYLELIEHLPYKPLDYVTRSQRCNFECLDCGYVFQARPSVVAKGKHKCPICKRAEITRLYVEQLNKEFPHITLVDKYHAKKSSKYRCTCGYEWFSKFVTKNSVRKVGCPKCDYQAGGPKLRMVVAGGRKVAVQGYEDIALDYLEQKGINLSRLAVRKEEGVPTVLYRWRKANRFYWPDFYYRETNTIYEVKSLFTLLSLDYTKTCAKAKACLKQGYRFKLILVHGNKKDGYILKLPKNWYSASQESIAEYLCHRYPELAPRVTAIAKDNPFVDSRRVR